MEKQNKLSTRLLSLTLSAALIFSTVPATVFATDGNAPEAPSGTQTTQRTIMAFDELGGDFSKSVPFDGHTYVRNVELNTPLEEVGLPASLSATVEKTTTTANNNAPAEKPAEPAAPADAAPAEKPTKPAAPADAAPAEKPAEPAAEPAAPATETTASTADPAAAPTEPAAPAAPTATAEAPAPVETPNGEAPPAENTPAEAPPTEEKPNSEAPPALAPPVDEPKQENTIVTETTQETIPVTWSGNKEYTPNQSGDVIFTPQLPDGYALSDSTKVLTICVTVGNQPEQEKCTCNIPCTEGKINADCKLCSAKGADLTACKGNLTPTEKSAYDKAVELFTALPAASVITTDTTEQEKEAIIAQLTKATDAYDALSEVDKARFDTEQAALLETAMQLNSVLFGLAPMVFLSGNSSDTLTLGALDPKTNTFKDATGSGTGKYKSIVVGFTLSQVDANEGIEIPSSINGYTYQKTISSAYGHIITVDGEGGKTAQQIAEECLRQIKFNGGAAGQSVAITLSFDRLEYRTFSWGGNGHFYQYVPFETSGEEQNTWLASYDKAKTMTYNGRKGYLATVTSLEEDLFIREASASIGWLGGTRMALKDGKGNTDLAGAGIATDLFKPMANNNYEGEYWYWACGPEAGEEFYDTKNVTTDNFMAKHQSNENKGYYFNWEIGTNDKEPNSGTKEAALATLLLTSNGGKGYKTGAGYAWNDLNPTSKNTASPWDSQGFFVEYGNLKDGDSGTSESTSGGIGGDANIEAPFPQWLKDAGLNDTQVKYSGRPATVQLSSEATLTNPIELPAGSAVTIDLNGKMLTAPANQPAIMAAGGKVELILKGSTSTPGSSSPTLVGGNGQPAIDFSSAAAGSKVTLSAGASVKGGDGGSANANGGSGIAGGTSTTIVVSAGSAATGGSGGTGDSGNKGGNGGNGVTGGSVTIDGNAAGGTGGENTAGKGGDGGIGASGNKINGSGAATGGNGGGGTTNGSGGKGTSQKPEDGSKLNVKDGAVGSLGIISFDARNGVDINDAKIDKGTSTITMPAEPTWAGTDYTFTGWWTEIDGAGTEFKNENLTANTKVYAKWTKGGKNVRTTPLDLTVASVTAAPDQGWTWDSGTKTLTLDGATIDCSGNAAVVGGQISAIQLLPNHNIVLTDSSINTVKAGNTTNSNSTGVYFNGSNGSYSISGKGTLYATGGAGGTNSASYGIYCGDGTLTLSDATIIATSSEGNTGIGISGALDIKSGNITAIGNSTAAGSAYGISAANSFNMTGGTLSASGKTAAVSMGRNGTITAPSATVTGATETFVSGTTKRLTQSGADPVVISFGPSISASAQTGAATYGTGASPTFAVTANSFGGTYPAFAPSVVWTSGNAPTGVTAEISANKGTLTVKTTEKTPAGEYKFKVVSPKASPATDKYESAEATLKVDKLAAAITWTGNSFPYNGKEQAPTATVTNKVGTDEVTVTVTGGKTDVGTGYTATANALTGAAAGNYKLPTTGLTQAFVITKATYKGTEAKAPTGTKTHNTVTLTAQTVTGETVEYGIKNANGSITWQDSASFSGLDSNTEYKFYTRVKESDTHAAGTTSDAVKIQTEKILAGVSGDVTDDNSAAVNGATVKIMNGTTQLAITTTVASGKYSFTNVPEGVYSLVVTKSDITVTKIIEIKAIDIKENIKLPSGKKNTVVETKPNTPPTAANGLNELFEKVNGNTDDTKGITATDLTTVTGGGSVTVTLTSTQKTETEVQGDANLIKGEAPNEKLLFLDFTVSKVVTPVGGTAGEPLTITELPAVVEIVVEIPEALLDAKSISVYRTHNNKTTKFASTADTNGEYAERKGNYMHVFARYFSTYALGYTKYDVTIADGGTGASGTGGYASGDPVTINAGTKSDYSFNGWTVTTGNATLVDPSSANTTFTMPSGNVTVTANWTYIGGSVNPPVGPTGGGGSGGGSSDDSSEYEFWMQAKEKINSANSGDVIKLTVKSNDKMPVSVMDTLRKNSGVTLVISWNGGKTITIPAGKAAKQENGRIYYPLSLLAKLYDGITEDSVLKPEASENPVTGGPSKLVPVNGDGKLITLEAPAPTIEKALPNNTESAQTIAPIKPKTVTPPDAGFKADAFVGTPDEKAAHNMTPITAIVMLLAAVGGALALLWKRSKEEQE